MLLVDQIVKSFHVKAAVSALITASQIGERFDLSSQRVNLLLAELGWIERQGPNWLPTAQGQALGAVKRHYSETGKAYPYVLSYP